MFSWHAPMLKPPISLIEPVLVPLIQSMAAGLNRVVWPFCDVDAIAQNENEHCAKMRRAAEPMLNGPPASVVERLKYGEFSVPTGFP